jgi:transposase
MATALSVDLRSRVIAAVDGGMSRRRAAARFGFSYSSAIRWVRQARETGDIAPKPQGGARRESIIDRHVDLVLEWITAEPDLTLSEIAARLDDAAGYRPPPSVVHDFFQRHGVTRKKRRHTQPSRTART